MNKKLKNSIIITGILLLSGWLIFSTINTVNYYNILGKVLKLVRSRYVETVPVDSLMKGAIKGVMEQLDPHSIYMSPREYKDLMINTEGEFGGLGIQISKIGNYITIVAPIEGTPAYRIGLQSGDKIVKIEGKSTLDMSLAEAVSKMRGKPGTKVTVTISREGEEPFDVTITREIIRIDAVPFFTTIDGIGYIRLSDFNKNAYSQTKKALNDLLNNKGVKGIVLDLRSNPGGLLDQAIELSSLFIDRGKVVVSTKGRNEYEEFKSRGNRFKKFPLIVLIDNGSASASEILSGSIQDWDRGLILGTRSFGKGSVQRVYPLEDGGAVKITIALWLTPSGRRISEYFARSDTANTYKTLVFGRIEKGGGGIHPDTTVPYPKRNKLTQTLIIKNIFFQFAVHYMAIHKKTVRDISDEMMKEFKKYIESKGIKYSKEDWVDSYKQNKYYLKMSLYEREWGTKGRYKALLSEDNQVKTAINILKQCKNYKDVFKFASKKAAAKN